MNFQDIADSFSAPTCVLSVEKTPEGGCGEIRIGCGNAKYLEPIEHPVMIPQANLPGVPEIFSSTNTFVPNSLYEKYLPKDKGFEDICFRSAVMKQPIHTYIHLNDMGLWFDIFAQPLEQQDGNISYCV